MHPSVRLGFVSYITEFEGRVRWMYLDSLGLVSTGIGTLLDPFDKFWRQLPFYFKPDLVQQATPAEIRAEFNEVKSRQDLASKTYLEFDPLTKLRVRDTDIDARVTSDVGGFENYLKGLFGTDYNQWPADAQLAVLSIVYGAGSLANSALVDACKRKDWWGARGSGNLTNKKQGAAGYATRNAGTMALFQNAYIVDQCQKLGIAGLDPTTLYGLKSSLTVARWQSDPAGSSPTMYPTDQVTAADITSWVKNRK